MSVLTFLYSFPFIFLFQVSFRVQVRFPMCREGPQFLLSHNSSSHLDWPYCWMGKGAAWKLCNWKAEWRDLCPSQMYPFLTLLQGLHGELTQLWTEVLNALLKCKWVPARATSQPKPTAWTIFLPFPQFPKSRHLCLFIHSAQIYWGLFA